MDTPPQFVYDKQSREVLLKSDNTLNPIFSDVNSGEFEKIRDVDEFVSKAAGLFDQLINSTLSLQGSTGTRKYFEQLDNLQRTAVNHYQQCIEYQEELSATDSEVVSIFLKLLYKLNKFLKHYFRTLSIGQSLAFSQRLSLNYLASNDYLYLYGFVRNTCSTVEYLGKLMTNRMGDDDRKIGLDNVGVNAVDVYEEIKLQGLDDVYGEDQTVLIPPNNTEMRMDEIGLTSGSMKYLWEKRCDMVHNCPLVVGVERVELLPDELVNTSVITESDVVKLTHLSHRLHFHTLSMFLRYLSTYLKEMLSKLVEILFHER